jgi:hypothetical protein
VGARTRGDERMGKPRSSADLPTRGRRARPAGHAPPLSIFDRAGVFYDGDSGSSVEVNLPPALAAGAPLTLTRADFEADETTARLFVRALHPVSEVRSPGQARNEYIINELRRAQGEKRPKRATASPNKKKA